MKKLLFITLIIVLSNALKIKAQVINTFEGGGTSYANGIPAITSGASAFRGIATDAAGNIYFSASTTPTPVSVGICKVSTSGILTKVAGGGTLTAEGTSALNYSTGASHGLAIDASGNIYFSEQSNHKIKKINTSGIVTTYVGTGAMGFAGDGGLATAAKLNNPTGICIDAMGNLYIADSNNHRIRKVSTNGIITTVAGNGTGGVTGEGGPAILASMSVPESVITDSSGNIYFCDAGYRVCKIAPSGTLTRIAGTGLIGFSGDGGPALSAQITPKAVAVDGYNNIYIADFMYNVVRKVNSMGIITTIAGQDGLSGFSGDGGHPLSALLSFPYGLLVTANCNLYITDQGNQRIRVITGSSCYVGIEDYQLVNHVTVSPNPSAGHINFTGLVGENIVQITDIMGRVLLTEKTNAGSHRINLAAAQGIYFYKITDKANRLQQGKLIIN
jgi:sugar lactone lactonase YvrE